MAGAGCLARQPRPGRLDGDSAGQKPEGVSAPLELGKRKAVAAVAAIAVLVSGFCLGRSSALGAATDPADAFFAPQTVPVIHLEIAPEDLDRMQRALPRRIVVPGTFRWNDHAFYPVGVRYKGNSSSMPDARHKRSFLVAFNEYRKGLRFLGLRHVALDNGIQFGSLFSERLITEVLRGEGVKASRCNHARVYLNGRPAGVYVNVERIDRSFLERHFGTAGGILFKVDEGGPGADLRYLGGDAALYRRSFELHEGSEAEAYAALLELARAVDPSSGAAVDLGKLLELEPFLKTTAVLLLAGAFDQYTGWGPHNYYLYRHPVDRRWTYIPWDLDVGFADQAFGRVPVLEGWHAAWPAPVPGRPLLERLLADPALLERYRAHANRILETWFRPEVLIPKLRAMYAQIQPALAEDPYPPRRITVPSDTGYPEILATIETFIEKRYALARAQLDAPGSRPPPKPSLQPDRPPMARGEGPQPGPPSADAPRQLRVVRAAAEGVELRWTDHAEGEMAFVVQRCLGADSTNFVNVIGQPGRDLTTAVDRDVRPGMTYRYRVYAVRPTPHGPRGTGVSNVETVTIPETRGQ